MTAPRTAFGMVFVCLAFALLTAACGGGAAINTGGGGGGGTGPGGSGGGSTGPIITTPRPFPGDFDVRLDPGMSVTQYRGKATAVPSALLCDNVHGQVFVSDKADNRISVLSMTDAHLLAALKIPAPVGLSLSPDGSTLYVGSENVQMLYVINAATLQVERQVSLPATLVAAGSDTWPYALADGSVMVVAGRWQVYPGSWPSVLQLWHPDTGVFDAPMPDPNPNVGGYDPLLPVRSADGRFLLLSAEGLYLYSAATHTIVASAPNPAGSYPFAIAISPDGSKMAQVTVRDQAMADETATLDFYGTMLQAGGQTQTAKGTFRSLFYSSDGHVLYDSTIGGNLAAETVGYDSRSQGVTGYLAIGMNYIEPELPQSADAGGALWGWRGGSVYKVADGLHPAYSPTEVGATGLVMSLPDAGPTAGGTEVPFQLPAGSLDAGNPLSTMQAYFGASPALKDEVGDLGSTNPTLLATSPPGAESAASVLLEDTQGNPNFFDDAFVYGAEILQRVPFAVPPDGGSMTLYGYGLAQTGLEGLAPSVEIKVGGKLVDLSRATANDDSIDQYKWRSVTFPAPAGSPGWADVTVSTGNDSDTVPHGVQYELQRTVLPGNFSHLVYDSQRNLFYALADTQQVVVFDPVAASTRTLASATAVTEGLAISPDDHYLVAGANNGVVVFDLQGTAPPQAVSLLQAGEGGVYGAAIAITAQDQAVVNLSGQCGPQSLRQLDLATLAVSVPSYSGSFCSPNEYAAASADGNVLLFSEIRSGADTGNSQRYDVASGTFTSISNSPAFGRTALDGDGQLAATGFYLVAPDLRPRLSLPTLPGALNETGSLLYTGEGIFDTHNGRELLKYGDYVGQGVAIDPAGSQVLVAGQDSDNHPLLIYHQLAVVPLAVGTVTPAQGSAGTTVQIRGSGFASGTTASLGGVAMSCTVSDSETMTCTVPQLPVGGAAMTLTNPDGQTYSFQLAFTVQ